MTKEEAKKKIEGIVKKTLKLIPPTYEENLSPIDLNFGGRLRQKPTYITEWHNYEHSVWQNGEKIRQVLCEHKSLRKDKELLDLFLVVALNRNAKRGRQSFIMLFRYQHCSEYADLLIKQIDDNFVNGHIIEGLNNMKVGKFGSIVKPFTTDKTTWIRNQAKKYIEKYGT